MEREAIKRRGLENGFDFLLLIPLESGVRMPPWYGPQRLYFDLQEWGVEQAAAVIESHAQRAGSVPHVESLEERAARILREAEGAAQKSLLMHSPKGATLARAEFDSVISLVSAKAKRMTEIGIKVDFRPFNYSGNPMAILEGSGLGVTIVQEISPGRSLEESEVNLALWKGPPPFGRSFIMGEPKHIRTEQFRFDFDKAGSPCWQVIKSRAVARSHPLSSEGLAQRAISILVDQFETNMRRRDPEAE